MLMVLAVSRRLPQLLELQRERTWQPLPGVELRDVTIGIVGLGSIGQAVASLATAFGCRVIATRRGASGSAAVGAPSGDDEADRLVPPPHIDLVLPPEGLPQLLAESDFVVLALPLTADTADLLDAPGPRPGQAGGLDHQRRARRARRRAGARARSRARGRWAAPSWTPSAMSRCPPTRRSTACPTASSRRTPRGRAGGS